VQDVRWKLVRQDQKPIREINGGSTGAAFVMGLYKLLLDA
jgi:hypothetical protein